MHLERIYLAGYMTSGKSTIGPILANVLGWEFFDLDKEIEKHEGKSVVEIFEENGEDYFREIETEKLKELSKKDRSILALGGGTIADPENFHIIRESGLIVYLKVSPENIYKRLKNKIDRPLFRDLVLSESTEEEFLDKISSHLNERIKIYELADITINTSQSKIGMTVDLLAKEIEKLRNEKKD